MKQNGSPFIVSRHPQKTDIPNKNIFFLPGLLRGFAPTASPARSLWAKTYVGRSYCHGFDNYHTQFLVVKKFQFWMVESTCWMAISKSSCLILTVSCLGDYPQEKSLEIKEKSLGNHWKSWTRMGNHRKKTWNNLGTSISKSPYQWIFSWAFHDRLPTSYRVAITGVSCMAAAARCAAAAAAFWTRALLAPACAAASAAAQPAASAAKVAASCGEREGKV